jgi:hypothetical protein
VVRLVKVKQDLRLLLPLGLFDSFLTVVVHTRAPSVTDACMQTSPQTSVTQIEGAQGTQRRTRAR